ncbi:DNA-binding MarR family transcriptional regulator [Sporosarcina luteola]|nr:DNA-binding MarR family transcriptional regulator [Sporosarcina luteola]
MKEKIKEAIELFEDVMIFGAAHVMKSVDVEIWNEFSPEQIQVLKILSTHGPLSNGKLAEVQGVHKSAVSTRLRKLEEKGLVTSSKDPDDQRTKVIELTSSGAEILKQADEAVFESIEKLFSGHIVEEEIDTFVNTFRKLKDILQMKGL